MKHYTPFTPDYGPLPVLYFVLEYKKFNQFKELDTYIKTYSQFYINTILVVIINRSSTNSVKTVKSYFPPDLT